jgi:hypothetical protein
MDQPGLRTAWPAHWLGRTARARTAWPAHWLGRTARARTVRAAHRLTADPAGVCRCPVGPARRGYDSR